jgi:hypothetical protein
VNFRKCHSFLDVRLMRVQSWLDNSDLLGK